MKKPRQEIIEQLLALGFSRKASGAQEFWREYRRRYHKLPDVKARARERQSGQEYVDHRGKLRKAARIRAKKGFDPLTRAQLAVALEVLKGKSNAQIAGELGLTVISVKFHLTDVYIRSGAISRAQFLSKWSQGELSVKVQRQLPTPPALLIKERALAKDLLPIGAGN